MNYKTFVFVVSICLLFVAQFSILQFPSVKAQEPQQNLFFDAHPDWQALWTLFNGHAMWDLEWQKDVSSAWVSVKSDLSIVRDYSKNDTCKITLIFNASQSGNYRLTFAIDARVRNYVTRLDKYQYELDYDDYSIIFDWSDVVSISGLVITHGMKELDGQEYFWFRMRRDAVPKGAYVEIDPTVIFTTVSVTSVHTCPLDSHTFVIAYHDEDNDDFSFQIYDTNGTQVLAETDVDDTSGGSMSYTSIGVSAFNSTTFVIGWSDKTDQDVTFAVYNKAGTLLSGPIDADDVAGYSQSVSISCFNSTYFVIGWYDNTEYDATFAVYNSAGTLKAGPIDAANSLSSMSFSVSVSCFNSTTFVIGWYDDIERDATFAIYNSAGTQIGTTIDADTSVGSASFSVSVSALNSTYFVIGWFDSYYTDYDITFAVYNSAGTLKAGPTDADTDVGTTSQSVQVSALNSTAFVISWYDYTDFDLSYAIYNSAGTNIVALTDIESWPTANNAPFRYQSPCSHESATNIGIYNGNWIIAYANTTTQAIWRAYKPDGTAWDGTIPSGGGYALNLRAMDWDLTDAITGAIVYKDSDTKTSNGGGWANWTGVSGTVAVKVKYYGFWVNGTFNVNVDSDKTINVKCKLYDVTITAKPNNNQGVVSGANVTAYNNTGTSNGKIKSGITVDITGQVTLTNVPNATLHFIMYAKSDYSIIIANTTQLISSDDYSFNIVANQNYAVATLSFGYEAIIWMSTLSFLPLLALISSMVRKKLKKRNGGEKACMQEKHV